MSQNQAVLNHSVLLLYLFTKGETGEKRIRWRFYERYNGHPGKTENEYDGDTERWLPICASKKQSNGDYGSKTCQLNLRCRGENGKMSTC